MECGGLTPLLRNEARLVGPISIGAARQFTWASALARAPNDRLRRFRWIDKVCQYPSERPQADCLQKPFELLGVRCVRRSRDAPRR